MSTDHDAIPQGQIRVSSGFGRDTQQPFVEIAFSGPTSALQLTTAEALDLALNILQSSEAAVTDGFLITFFTREMDVPIGQAAVLLGHFRQYRESLGGPAAPRPRPPEEE